MNPVNADTNEQHLSLPVHASPVATKRMSKSLVNLNTSRFSIKIDIHSTKKERVGEPPKLALSWSNVNYTVVVPGKDEQGNPKVRKLLDNVSGCVNQGEVVAIMGGSGAGKSTLMNTLAGRIAHQKGSSLTGDILLNGKLRDAKTWRRICAYVEQDDVMFRNFTVEEVLTTAANLRLPSSMSKQEKKERVNDIIMELGLNGCRNTRIGDTVNRGISGGERKRVSIGIELVTDPHLLFLDEPTSGLDAATSLNIIETIKKLAVDRGIVVLMTIHQPRKEVLHSLDGIVLLSVGKTVWFGTTDGALQHFQAMGHDIPDQTNPSDFFLDIITLDQRSEEFRKESMARIEKFNTAWQEKIKSENLFNLKATETFDDISDMKDEPAFQAGAFTEFLILLKRSWLSIIRDRTLQMAVMGQASFMALIYGSVYYNLKDDEAGVQSRTGMLFGLMMLMVFASVIPIITSFPEQRAIFKRERASASYRAASAFFSNFIASVPLYILSVLVLATPIYFLTGLQRSVGRFLTFCAISVVQTLVSLAIGYAIGSAVPTAQVGLALAPSILILFVLFSGLLLNLNSVGWGYRWIQYISFTRYSYASFLQNELNDFKYSCDPLNLACPKDTLLSGENVISGYGLQTISLWHNLAINCGIFVFILMLGYILFNQTSRSTLRLK